MNTRTNPNSLSPRLARAAIDDATRLARPWVANRAISNGGRALAQDKLFANPGAERISLGAADARSLYALVEASVREADQHPRHRGAVSPAGLPVGADGLGSLAFRGAELGSMWLERTPGGDKVYLPVALEDDFRAELRSILGAETDAAIARSPEVADRVEVAAERAAKRFLSGSRRTELRHGGRFEVPRARAELSPHELARMARAQEAARVGAAFGFGEVFGRGPRHGCPLG